MLRLKFISHVFGAYIKQLFFRYKKLQWFYRWIFNLTFGFTLIFFILNAIFPLRVNIAWSPIIMASDNTILHVKLSSDDKWRMQTRLDEITPQLRNTIIYKEDKYFYYHPGVNPVAIVRAAFNNIIRGRRTSGASTITMQVARMLNRKNRTIGNKIIEAFRALQLEMHYSKDEIFQLYLNLIPYGGNIEGVKTAASVYFDQKPEGLSLAQIITLSIIPNNPNLALKSENREKLISERNKWIQRIGKSGFFKNEIIEDALHEPIGLMKIHPPKKIPHLSRRLINTYPDQIFIYTWIKPDIQSKTENILFQYSQQLRSGNIHNAAIMVIDNKTNHVVAYAGSPDFYDKEDHGEVDGIKAVRSPGSTLKPILYAIAFDKGIITPKMTITDVPVDFKGYCPENYDGTYNGIITVEKALALSLNIPAVKILDAVGVKTLTDKLIRARFQTIKKQQKQLGLSLILGGCGVTLEELANLFSTFSHNGVYQKALLCKNESINKPDTIISDAASFVITQNLTQLLRPDLPTKFENSINLPKIAWKTGTSYGRRDAWSIGYNKDYTIAVWVGNFTGIGIPELNGTQYATPLLFELFNTLDYNSPKNWFTEPKSLDLRLVCSETGLIPNDFCINQITDYYMPGISPATRCQHLKEVFTDPKEHISYCRSCMPDKGYKTIFYPNFPPDLLVWYDETKTPYKKIPPHNPKCERVFQENGPQIISLTDGMEYILLKNEKQQLTLRCHTEPDVEKVHWYINDKFYKTTVANDKLFFTPESGTIKISCSDDQGRNTNIWIKVTFI